MVNMSKRRNSRKRRNSSIKKLKFINKILKILIIIFTIILVYSINKTKKISQNSDHISDVNIAQDVETQDKNTNKTNEPTPETTKDTTINMAFTGDIMCHNTIYNDAYNSSSSSYDFSYIFDNVKFYLQTADITIGNLETTFAGSKKGYSSYPRFNTPESLADTLKKLGFDVLSTANNHCYDSNYAGIESTIDYLDQADISHTGTYKSEEDQNKILIKNVKGINIAFLSFTYGTNGITVPQDKAYSVNLIDKELIKKQIDLAKAKNPDLISVSMHWGVEYQTKPNTEQKELADFLFQNGVDLIIGNHPHVLQPMEKRTITLSDGSTKDGFIVYSLGNFLADQNKTYTRDTAILNLKITKSKDKKITIDSASYTPVYIYKNTALKTKKFKLIDLKKSIASYNSGSSTNISKTLYNTFNTELNNITKILGEQ